MGLTEQQIKLLRYYIQHGVLSYDIVPSDYDRLEDLGLIEKMNSSWHQAHPRAGQPLPTHYQASDKGKEWLKRHDEQLKSS